MYTARGCEKFTSSKVQRCGVVYVRVTELSLFLIAYQIMLPGALIMCTELYIFLIKRKKKYYFHIFSTDGGWFGLLSNAPNEHCYHEIEFVASR